MRLIDADAWYEFYTECTKDLYLCDHYHLGYEVAMDYVDDWLDARPTIEARPVVRGEWIKNGWNNYSCSDCGSQYIGYGASNFKFCPNCGADMRGDEDGKA